MPQETDSGLQAVPPMDIAGLLSLVWQGKWRVLAAITLALLITGYYAFHIASPRYGATATVAIAMETDAASLGAASARITAPDRMAQVIAAEGLLSDPAFNRYLTAPNPFAPDTLRRQLRHLIAGTVEVPPTTDAIHDKTVANLQAAIHVTCDATTSSCAITVQSGDPARAVTLANTVAATFVAAEAAAATEAANASEDWLLAQLATLQTELARQDAAVNQLLAAAQMQDSAAVNALSTQLLRLEETLRTAQTQAAVTQMTAQRDRLRAQLATQSAGLMELQQLQRAAETTRALHAGVLERLNAARIAHGLQPPPATLAQAARQASYVGPQKLLLLQAAALIGALAGLGWIGWQHLTGDRLQNAAALARATGIPVLASVPRLRPGWLGRRQRAGGLRALYSIKAQLLLDGGGGGCPQVICCTSGSASGTATPLITQLATALRSPGKRVLLILPDTRKRPWAGLADVIAGTATAESVTRQVCGVDVIGMGGATSENPTMMAGFAAALAALRTRYAHIVIAAPPLLQDPSTLLWVQAADATLVLVSWPKARRSALRQLLQQIVRAHGPAAGLILIDVPRRALRQGNDSGTALAPPAPAPA